MTETFNKNLSIAIVVLLWALVGCQSEVDKCVNALVKNGSAEAGARLMCLKAQSGKE
jgi:hypothetical protein